MMTHKAPDSTERDLPLPVQVIRRPFFTLKRLADSFVAVKRLAIFAGVVVIGLTLYKLLITYTFADKNFTFGLVGLWFLTAYLVLPRLHKILTALYVPNYYIGRARTGEGLLSDPVNLAVIGSRAQLIAGMEKAGWKRADDLNAQTTYKMVRATLLRRSYPTAPVSSLFLFGGPQEITFQQEIDGSTSKRHHVRFWKTPDDWFLPGGRTADWLGAATYDSKVGFSAYTFQFTHKIGEHIDDERDYVVSTLRQSSKDIRVDMVKHFSTGYHTRNGGGDTIRTDGAMPFIHLSS